MLLRRCAALFAVSASLAVTTPGFASADTFTGGNQDQSHQIANRKEAPYITGPARTATPAAGTCGVRVDKPHKSGTTAYQVHTRVESYCRDLPMQTNQVSGTTFRSRWYGWEKMGSAAAGPNTKNPLRITVAISVSPGDVHQWRTEATGTAVINGTPHTASAYEQSDREIRF